MALELPAGVEMKSNYKNIKNVPMSLRHIVYPERSPAKRVPGDEGHVDSLMLSTNNLFRGG